MGRLNLDRQQKLEPLRVNFSIQKLQDLGFIICLEDETQITFKYKKNLIYFFPYSGWYQGKGIQSGRGLFNLLKQLKWQ